VELSPIEEVEAASRRSESVDDAPASVTIIPSQELRALQQPTVWEAVRGVRGVYLSNDTGYPTVGFRGFGRPGDYGNRVLVTVDGQPMNDNWVSSSYTSFDLRTDLEDIERIEIVRGPGSVLYGTGAFTGVINLVTRRDAPTSAEFGVSESGDGMSRARARANVKLGEDSGVWTSVAGGHSQGRDFFFPEMASGSAPNVGGYSRGVDGLDAATVAGRIWWKSLTAQWSYNTQTKQLPAGEFKTLLGDARTRQTDDRAMLEARFEPKIGPWLESLTRAHFNYYTYDGHFASTPDLGGLGESAYEGMWVGLEQRVVVTPVKALGVTAGGEVQAHVMAKQHNQDELNGVTLNTSDTFRVGAG
jgi:outer membrane receptor protein involved in Fe transport